MFDYELTKDELIELRSLMINEFYNPKRTKEFNQPLMNKIIAMIGSMIELEKPPEATQPVETIEKVIHGDIPITVKPSCHHSFKMLCAHCSEWVTVSLEKPNGML